MAPRVMGFTWEPRTLTICSSATVTVKLHVSAQSRGHTLGKVWIIHFSLRCAIPLSQPEELYCPLWHYKRSDFWGNYGTIPEGVSDLLIWYPLLEAESDQLCLGIP